MRTPVLLLLAVGLSACAREERDFRGSGAPAGAADRVVMSELRPGPSAIDASPYIYQENRWAVSEGMRLYTWFNCSGCHAAGGGGGIGPPLRDDEWIYGSGPDNIYSTIVQGRPDGMPAFRDRIDPADVWKLVAYVRAVGRLTPKDTWSARSDNMAETSPWRSRTDSAGLERRILH